MIIVLISVLLLIIKIYFLIADIRKYKESTYYKITGNSYFSVHYDLGLKGEYEIFENLKKFEEIGCKFLFNLYLPKEDGKTSEIDILMIHSKGIFVIESKNYSGWIFGNEKQYQWTQCLPTNYGEAHKEYFYNPIYQNQSHIRTLRTLIDDKIPVFSVIAFSDSCTLKKVSVSNRVIVTQYCDIENEISSKLDEIKIITIDDSKIDELYSKLYEYTQVSQNVREQHIQNIEQNDMCVENGDVSRNKIIPIFFVFVVVFFLLFNFFLKKEENNTIDKDIVIKQKILPPKISNIEEEKNIIDSVKTYQIKDKKNVRETKKLEKKQAKLIKKEQKRKIKKEKKELKAEKKRIKAEMKAKKRASKKQHSQIDSDIINTE